MNLVAQTVFSVPTLPLLSVLTCSSQYVKRAKHKTRKCNNTTHVTGKRISVMIPQKCTTLESTMESFKYILVYLLKNITVSLKQKQH